MNKEYVLDKKKAKIFLINILGIFLLLFLCYKSIYYFLPFIIALLLSFLIEPFVKLMVNKLNLSRKISSALGVILILFTLGFLLSLLVLRLIKEIKDVLLILPSFINDFYKNITQISSSGNNLIIGLPKELTQYIGELLSSLFSYVGGLLNNIAKSLVNTAFSLPALLVFILITILSTYFLSSDRKNLHRFLETHFPKIGLIKYIL